MNVFVLSLLLACQQKKTTPYDSTSRNTEVDLSSTNDIPVQSQPMVSVQSKPISSMQSEPTEKIEASKVKSKLAPGFSLRSIDRETITLSDYRGTVVLVYFWATWCKICKHEMPLLESLYKDLKGRNFTVLAISADDTYSASKVKIISRRNGYTFPVLLDSSQSVLNTYTSSQNLPYKVLVNEKGEVIWENGTYNPEQESQVKSRVTEALRKAGL